jgi:hypothetical protein
MTAQIISRKEFKKHVLSTQDMESYVLNEDHRIVEITFYDGRVLKITDD